MNLLRDVNPVTRILGLALLTTPLMFTVDWVSAAFVIAFTLLMAVSYTHLTLPTKA